MSRKKRKNTDLIVNFLEVNRTILEGEKRIAYLKFLKSYEEHGLYALYKDQVLWYVGKAGNLKMRIDQHLKDKHGEGWDRFSIFMFSP